VEVLNKLVFLTAKPIVYLLNMSKEDFLSDKKLPNEDKLMAAITHNGKHPTRVIRYSVEYEQEESEDKSKSQIDTIIQSGY
jgi:ribosome-binding ATPase YchF (GTP1/OBG family)